MSPHHSAIVLTVLTLAWPAGAQTNWPSFRGANAEGLAKGTATAAVWNVEKSEHVLWKTAIPGLGHSSPIIWGDRLFVTSAVNERKAAPLKVGLYGDPASAEDNDVQQWKVFCLNKLTGEEIWRMSGGGDCPVPTPVVWNGLIFLTSAHGPRRPMYAVRTDAIGDVSLRDGASTNRYVAWSALHGGSYMQTPLVYGDYLYSCHVDGILSCYEARTGKQMYKERLGTGNDGSTASPVASEGRLYFTSEQGTVYVVKPGADFTVLATNQISEVCMATPAISGATIFFRTQGHVVAVGGRK
jgi:outer membrane protein assembly factor BamB